MAASRSDGPSPVSIGVKVGLASRRLRRMLNIGVVEPRKVDRAVNPHQVTLDTLTAAIEALREPVDVTDPRRAGRCLTVANDLAWLHSYLLAAVPGDRGQGHTASPTHGSPCPPPRKQAEQ